MLLLIFCAYEVIQRCKEMIQSAVWLLRKQVFLCFLSLFFNFISYSPKQFLMYLGFLGSSSIFSLSFSDMKP